MKSKKILKNGFTLIELLIVVTMIGILSGVTTSVINPDKSRKVVEEGVQQANLQKLSQALEAYCLAEGGCPIPGTDFSSPFENSDISDDELLNIYISAWPEGVKYNANGEDFAIWVESPASPAKYYKYSSAWLSFQECGPAEISNIGSCEGGEAIELPPEEPIPTCGDGVINQDSEQCDEGEEANGTTCTALYDGQCTYCGSDCQTKIVTGPFCGDNNADTPNEDCDGTDLGICSSDEACNSSCNCESTYVADCGNNIIDFNEQCDEGESVNGIPCTAPYDGQCTYCGSDCQTKVVHGSYCGDGNIDSFYEECDYNSSTTACTSKYTCNTNCVCEMATICSCKTDSDCLTQLSCTTGVLTCVDQCYCKCVDGGFIGDPIMGIQDSNVNEANSQERIKPSFFIPFVDTFTNLFMYFY